VTFLANLPGIAWGGRSLRPAIRTPAPPGRPPMDAADVALPP
jgi:hypothetical protein